MSEKKSLFPERENTAGIPSVAKKPVWTNPHKEKEEFEPGNEYYKRQIMQKTEASSKKK